MDALEKIGYKKENIKDGILYRRKPILISIDKINSTINIINEMLCISGMIDFKTIAAINEVINSESF